MHSPGTVSYTHLDVYKRQYLTGAASWYMLTMITEVFGVKGDCGDLKIAPALMPEQYNQDGKAVLKLSLIHI